MGASRRSETPFSMWTVVRSPFPLADEFAGIWIPASADRCRLHDGNPLLGVVEEILETISLHNVS